MSIFLNKLAFLAPVAQVVEHRVVMREVVSSIPAGPALRVLKCYFNQKLTPIFFFQKSKVLMFNTYHAKLQAFMSTRSVIN